MPKVYINQVKRLRVRERVIIVGICKYMIKINIATSVLRYRRVRKQ